VVSKTESRSDLLSFCASACAQNMSSERDILDVDGSDVEDDASWDDWEEEEGTQEPTRCLLGDEIFGRAEEALEHDKRLGFDLIKVCADLGTCGWREFFLRSGSLKQLTFCT
jgi:hypothetical protein